MEKVCRSSGGRGRRRASKYLRKASALRTSRKLSRKIFPSTSPSSFNNVSTTTNQKQVSRERGWLDSLAFMAYHESVKHIILMYDSGEKESAAPYNKRVSNVPHTIFFFAARQKALFRIFCLPSGGENIFHRRQKENKRIFPLLAKHFLKKLLRLHHLFVTHKKATSK